ncbi:G-type lectin S-receptor-like serine/threonine-protein kinase At2g19130 [Impatiens glandulifera]|uniref:G-type lectin S-receptor-like serine/threonine-protein kinase At2g19130 n=1 Tax=Impatiens glandulifera TaxID=253017 RepID=UPI001FB0581E|nr:G-type lectin S-receptor-like serine/threonine-protein kinase At2g19130 [Impatiens glandulifera]
MNTILFVAAAVVLLLHFSFIHGGNTISSNQILSGNQTIVSAHGIYELGFFKPGNSSSKNYIGIWYHNIHPQTVVWVANRDKPISDTHSSQLKILGRKLILLQSQTLIWSTDEDNVFSPHNSSSNIEAILGDNGNFVLTDESIMIWQSFDHPVDTWLPGSKLSYNKLTNRHQIITSWKNYDDPSLGLFSIELDASNNEYISRWNRSVPYWFSGSWDGEIFSNVPEMKIGMFYNWSYIDNENESYFTYSTFNTNLLTRFFLDLTGQVKQTTWIDGVGWNLFWTQPGKQCDVYASCGPNGVCNQIQMPFCNCIPGFTPKSTHDWDLGDFSGGCVMKNTQLKCHHKEGFKLLPGFRLPDSSIPWPVESEKDCETSCFNNCSCFAYAYGKECLIWSEGLLNLEQLSLSDGNGKSIYIKLAAGEHPSGKRSTRIIMGAAVLVFLGAVSVLGLVLFYIWWKKIRWVGVSKMEGYLIAFVYKDLQIATKNFSEKLGGGAFGSVYKGMLKDSTLIAVKRLDSIRQGEKQFRMEVSTIGTVQHVNLVRLRGFCSEGDNRLLVYDYMQNGSLGSVLFHEENSKTLDWKTRQRVAIGIARGLTYLHEKCRDCIVHCDIKPENILLDSEFCPMVADFGLAKLIGRDFSRVLTTIRGTRGYLAPEWISGQAITAKADVYSYGMMVFELISGRRNSEWLEDERIKFFPTLAANLVLKGGDIVSLLDDRLDRTGVEAEDVMRIYKVACWCIQNEESDRPTMGEVVQILEGVKDVNQPPIPRLLQVFVDKYEDDQDDGDLFFFTDPAAVASSSTDKSRQN